MKILMLLEKDFPPDLRVENEIKSLVSAGHTLVMACFTLNGNDRIEDWRGCKVYKFKISKWVYQSSVGALKFSFYFNFWRQKLEVVVANEKPEAVHIHDLPLARIGAELKNKLGIKFVLDLHENWPAFLRISRHTNTFLGKILSSNKKWESYEKDSCQQADWVIVVIEEAQERLEVLGIPGNKIRVVANYPVLADFDKLPEVSKDPAIISLFYAGGIGEHRGLQFVIQALPEILKKFPQVKLKILGDGNYRYALEKLSLELKVSEAVEFTGQVPYEIVLEELAKADIAVIPHVKSDHTDSTIPHKLFQYMYAGKPVIASNCKPIERIVKSSKAGAIYQWDSPQGVCEAFDFIVIHGIEISKVKESISKNYNWRSAASILNKIYEG